MWILASIGSICVTLLCEDEDMCRIGRDRVRKEERSKEDSGGRKHGEEEREKKKRNRENKHNARQSRNEDQYTSTEQNELDAGTSKS